MKNCLIITGNEVNHNFFTNSLIKNCSNYNFSVVKIDSGKNDFEFFYPIFNNINKKNKERIIEFIFNRNKTLCIKEDFELLKSIEKEEILEDSEELFYYLEKALLGKSYDLIITYSSPIIKNKKIFDILSFNLHLGLSRFYRGGTSNITALSRGEFNKVGATCHKLKPLIDGGDALFEVKDFNINSFNNIDEMNYYLLKNSINKMIELINRNDFDTYQIPKGYLIQNKTLTSKILIQAEENLKKVSNKKFF